MTRKSLTDQIRAAAAEVTPEEVAIAAGTSSPAPGQEPDLLTGESAEQPLPETAAPPPPMPEAMQKTKDKLGLDAIRKNRSQIVAVTGEVVRIPVIDKPNSELYIRAHPTFGGLNDPLPIWHRGGVGKGSGLKLVAPSMVDLIRANGGKVFMAAMYWCQYSTGGQFLAVVNAESDNDFIASARAIYEACRTGWFKKVNTGNCYDKLPPPIPIPIPLWANLAWDEVLNLSFDETVDTPKHPEFLSLIYGGHLPVATG
jgi:hypothetical protein